MTSRPSAGSDDTVPPSDRQILDEISRVCADLGVEAYLVGGFVRDMLLGRPTQDLDLAVDGDSRSVAQAIADAIGGRPVVLDEVNEVVRIVVPELRQESPRYRIGGLDGAVVDVVPLPNGLEADLDRRDFTIDAMAVLLDDAVSGDVSTSLIDRHDGRKDLQDRVVRAVTPRVFDDDPIRLMRAVRLSAQLRFRIDPDTADVVRQRAGLVTSVAAERVRDELLKTLAEPGAAGSLRMLDDLGLLMEVVPELASARGVEQPPEHHYDVLDHLTETVNQIERLLQHTDDSDAADLAVAPTFDGQDAHFVHRVGSGHTRLTLLKFVGLLHDVAKPATKTIEPSGRIRFFGHGDVGAEMAADIMARLRFSRKETELVRSMIEHHLRPTQMSQNTELPTHRAVYRFYRDLDDAAIDVLYLNLADYLAAKGPQLDPQEWADHCRLIDHVLRAGFEDKTPKRIPRLIDGNDIMHRFGIPPGPNVGTLLELVQEARAAGEIATKEEALDLVAAKLETGGKGA